MFIPEDFVCDPGIVSRLNRVFHNFEGECIWKYGIYVASGNLSSSAFKVIIDVLNRKNKSSLIFFDLKEMRIISNGLIVKKKACNFRIMDG